MSHIALILVDHPHVFEPSVHGKRHEDSLQELGEIHRSLKALAVELNIPVVVFTPIACPVVSRSAKRLKRSDPRKSDPEKAIDHVLFLYRDEFSELGAESKNMDMGRIMITKHRHGLVTEIDISI